MSGLLKASASWHFQGMIKSDQDERSWTKINILPSQWVPIVSKMTKDNPTFEIWLVKGTGPFEGL
jgi:hypothetical protein